MRLMDDDALSLLPDSIYREIYLGIARAQGAAHFEGLPFSWTSSVHPVWGRACFDIDLSNGGDEALASLAATMRELDCTALTGPSSRPSDLEARLEGAGFLRAGGPVGMVLRPEEFRPRSLPDGTRAAEPESPSDWKEWSAVLYRFLFNKGSEDDIAGFARLGSELASGGRFRAWLVRGAGGEALAASAALRVPQEAAGVFFVAVDEAARRRGLGAAVTSLASEGCFRSGASFVALGATVLGRPVYEALGYRAVSMMTRWRAPVGSEHASFR